MTGSINDWHMTDDLHAESGQGDPFAAAVRATRMAMVITNPRTRDNPIVFANDAFLRLTGYSRDEVIGRNCRFLQGPATDLSAVARIRQAVAERHDVAVDLLNYRKDGSTFWNGLYVSPVSNPKGELQFFFSSQLDVTDRVEAQMRLDAQKQHLEDEVARRTKDLQDALAAKTMLVHEVDHRVKNNLQMISSLIAMQASSAKSEETRQSLAGILSRVESIGMVHRRLYQSQDVQTFDLSDFIRDIAAGLHKASGRDDIALKVDLEPIQTPAHQASPLALMLNELMTNALKHGFPNGYSGQLSIEMRREPDALRIVLSDDGVGMPANTNTGFGSRLVRAVARQLQAEVVWRGNGRGTQVEIRAPIEPREQKHG